MIRYIKIFFFRTIFFVYIIIPQRKRKINLAKLNFRNIDFINYKKIRFLIFKKKFINDNSEPTVYSFDFINYCNKIGGKKGIEIAKKIFLNGIKIIDLKIIKLGNQKVYLTGY